MSEIRYFQWLASERKGEIVIFDKLETEDGMVFINFKDGSRINETLVAQINERDASGKYMAEIDSPNNGWKFEETYIGREEEKWETNADGEKVCVQPFVEGRKSVKLIPPRPTAPKKSNFGTIDSTVPEISNNIPNLNITSLPQKSAALNDAITSVDPVYLTLSKAKKVDTNIDIELTLSLPSIDLYRVLKESFDDGEENILSYIVDNIDTTDIKEAIKESLRSMYNNQNEDK
jgi:hypothetical protein